MMLLTDFYKRAVAAVEEITRSHDDVLTAAGLHCRIVAGEDAHTREGHPELCVELWAVRNLVDVIEFTPDISYPDGGDTKELGEWFNRELDRAIETSGVRES